MVTDLKEPARYAVRFAPTRFQAARDFIVEISTDGVRFRERTKREWKGPVPLQTILAKAESYDFVAVAGSLK